MPANIPADIPLGIFLTSQSKLPLVATTKVIRAATRYDPIASLTVSPGNRDISNAVPGADQAVTTGDLYSQLKYIPDNAEPIEIAQTQEDKISDETFADLAAQKKITSGPEYEIKTAKKPAKVADNDQSRNKLLT